jgi:hypothetical protein
MPKPQDVKFHTDQVICNLLLSRAAPKLASGLKKVCVVFGAGPPLTVI